jgi:hypothetical protein
MQPFRISVLLDVPGTCWLLRLAALALPLLAALTFGSVAEANIVIGQSVAGVNLGDTEAQVQQVLGPPSSHVSGSFIYPTQVGLRVGFSHGRVDGVLSFSKKQKTSQGITIGSSRAQVKHAYPQASCLEGPYGPSSLYCAVSAHVHGRKSFTSFLFGTPTGGVTEIELGYGVGLAQELKAQQK